MGSYTPRLHCTLLLLCVLTICHSTARALRGQTLGKFYSYSDPYNDVDISLDELPLPYEVPLPEECTVPQTNTRSFNQGQCSRKPCTTKHGPCSQSLKCCYEVGQTSSVSFLCSKSNSQLKGMVIVTCTCQVCDKLHTRIKGRALSSQNRNPVVLVAIMVGSEVATFTDENGYFSFELSTSNGDITLIFQEARHRQLEVVVNIRHSKQPELNIVMEHIDTVQSLDKVHFGFTVELSNEDETTIDQGLSVYLGLSPRSLVNPDSLEVYEGSGQLLYSLYSSRNRPDFTSKALSKMVYVDSKGVEFSIQSYAICSMEIVGENGRALLLRSGAPITLKLVMKFDMTLTASDVSNLHLFVYSKTKSRWLDYGKVGIMSVKQQGDEYGTFVTIQQSLREINELWAVGIPVRVTCYIKAFVSNVINQQELLGVTLNLEQGDTSLNRPTFYQYSDKTRPGLGVCLKAVCSYGGIIHGVSTTEGSDEIESLTAVSPSVDIGIVMGNREQIMFYETGKAADAQSPYYTTEEACRSSTKVRNTYFEFTANHSANKVITQPSMFPLVYKDAPKTPQVEFCFVKVSVYDCAPFTEIKVLSYSSKNHNQLLSLNTAVAMGTATDNVNTCQTSNIVGLRASCIKFTCGSDVHVTVQSQNHKPELASSRSRSSTGHSIDCRYWSSNRNTNSNDHPSENMKSFHLADRGVLPPSSGVYRSSSASLALLQCMSGNSDAPGDVIEPGTGVAVTFTCLF